MQTCTGAAAQIVSCTDARPSVQSGEGGAASQVGGRPCSGGGGGGAAAVLADKAAQAGARQAGLQAAGGRALHNVAHTLQGEGGAHKLAILGAKARRVVGPAAAVALLGAVAGLGAVALRAIVLLPVALLGAVALGPLQQPAPVATRIPAHAAPGGLPVRLGGAAARALGAGAAVRAIGVVTAVEGPLQGGREGQGQGSAFKQRLWTTNAGRAHACLHMQSTAPGYSTAMQACWPTTQSSPPAHPD